MRPEADPIIGAWRDAYHELAEASKQQLIWVKENAAGAEPEAWEAFERITVRRSVLRSKIEELQEQLSSLIGDEAMAALFEEQLASVAETIRVLTRETSSKIELVMVSTGTELNHAQNHRKVSHAYGKQEHDHQESMFFDQKK